MKISLINNSNVSSCGKKINKKQIIATLAAVLLSGRAKAQNEQICNPYKSSYQPIQQYLAPYYVVQDALNTNDDDLQIYNCYRNDNQAAGQYVTQYYPTLTPVPTQYIDFRAPEGSDFYYAILQYGDKYEIQAHYDSAKDGVGAYYQYGNQAFTKKDGKRIQNPEKLYGFIPIKENNNQSTNQQYQYYPSYPVYPSYPTYSTPTPIPAPSVDSRAPEGSDFYYTILRYGDKYKIQAHYDAGGGIGSYYQYGPWAFDKQGKRISNPEKLWGFDKNIK